MTEEQEQIPGTEYPEVSMTPLFAFISGIAITIALFLIIGGISLYYINQSYENEKIAKQADSIDRIDNNIGYIIGNVQWVYKKVNRMRREYTINEYIDICKKVAINQGIVL